MDIVAGLRQVIQDLLVPELKAIQAELKHHNQQLGNFSQEMKELRQEMQEGFRRSDERWQALRQEMQEGFRRSDERWEALAEKLMAMDGKLDVVLKLIGDYKEVARLAARMDQVEKDVAWLKEQVTQARD